MADFVCPVDGCQKRLKRLQVMHFRSGHGCDPVEWVEKRYGPELNQAYESGSGCYVIADKYEWLSSDMVLQIVETRSHQQSVTGGNNPMKRDEVAEQFAGSRNPAKQPEVRSKISESLEGHTLSEGAKQKISEKNTGNTICEAHKKAVAQAAASRDTSYMTSEEYRQAVSNSLKGREPTYPKPYEVEELSHEVRSSYEETVAKMLLERGIEYTYEKRFELADDSAYYLDFLVRDVAVEVKGWANERSIAKAEAFMTEFPSYTYVVVGDKIPCDIHIKWEERDKLPGVIDNG